jgi:hypothetical protein
VELDPAWAAKPLALTRHEGRTILVLEDPGGEPLVLVAPGEGAIMAAPAGAMAPWVEGSERARRCGISLASES